MTVAPCAASTTGATEHNQRLEYRMTSTITFGQLPERLPSSGGGRRPSERWLSVARQLRARPGEWAKVHTAVNVNTATSTAALIRGGRLAAFRPARAYEAVSRGADVWARYIGAEAVSS